MTRQATTPFAGCCGSARFRIGQVGDAGVDGIGGQNCCAGYMVDVWLCPHCGAKRRLLAAIHDPESIRRVLGAMGLPAEVPVRVAARSPPEVREWCD